MNHSSVTLVIIRKFCEVVEGLVMLVVKNSPANAGDKRYEFDPWVGKIS